MSLGKLLAAVLVLALVGVGVALLLGRDPELYDPPEVAVAPEARIDSSSYELGAFSADSTSLPLLIVGEHDVVIRGGALDDDGNGWIDADTGTTGMTGADLVHRPDHDSSEPSVAFSRAAAAAGSSPRKLYAERRLEDVAIGRYDESGIEAERELGEVLVRALGEAMNPLVIGSTGPVAVFRQTPGGALVALDATLTVDAAVPGRLTVEGTTEIGALLDLLAALADDGRLEPAEDGESVEVSGVTVEVYGAAGSAEPLELEPTEMDGRFRVKSRARDRGRGGWGALSELVSFEPRPRGAGALIVFSGTTVEVFD